MVSGFALVANMASETINPCLPRCDDNFSRRILVSGDPLHKLCDSQESFSSTSEQALIAWPMDLDICAFPEQSDRNSSDADRDIRAVLIRGPRGPPDEFTWDLGTAREFSCLVSQPPSGGASHAVYFVTAQNIY